MDLSNAASAPSRDGRHILLVDDEEALRPLIAEVLEDAGHRVVQAADGQAALAALRSGARFDLLVTDVGLPGGLNGRQVADAARQLRPGLPTIFVTGYAEGAAIGENELEDGMRVLTKPFDLAELASLAAEALAPAGPRT